jgi:hypothetical protein
LISWLVAFETAVLATNPGCPGCSEILAYSKKDYSLNNI